MTKRWALAWVGLGLLVSLAGTLYRRAHLVGEASFEALEQAVRAAYAPGDLIVVTPPYIAAPRRHLGDLPLLETRALSATDLAGVTRVLLVDLDVQGHNDTVATALASATPEPLGAWPGVRLTAYRVAAPERVVFDLERDLERARVQVKYSDADWQACGPFAGDRFACPKDRTWNYVGRTLRDVDNRVRRCVWMHPVAKGGLLRIDLPDLAAGARRVLIGMGFVASAAERARAPVELTLSAGDTVVWRGAHAPGLGWEEASASLDNASPLSLTVKSDNNGSAHFCAELLVLER